MTTGGWIIMILSVGGVTGFFLWTLYMVLRNRERTEHMHSVLEEPPDVKEDR
ncbi:MAG: hypothetical protein HS115_13990 [Spirochaetales bacterium]|nr:hypothetical protein [Spirochaetales bacterium]